MSIDPRLLDLLAHWEERREKGESLTPEELCRNCPDLIHELRQAIRALDHLDPLIGKTDLLVPPVPPHPDPGEGPSASYASLRYEPIRLHARGGLGEVYLARDRELNREVALKQMQEGVRVDADLCRRFLLEAEVTGRLEHPGIVPVYGLGLDEQGRPFYAMRFIRGESLQEAISRFHAQAQLDPGERRLLLRQLLTRFLAVCNTMAYAHSRGILHRDLKPANIMLGPYGETLVVDWGLARAVPRTEQNSPVKEGVLTPTSGSNPGVTRGIIGTPAYMSPEQAAGQSSLLGPASDIYSLGVTLYVLLTNKLPFQSHNLEELLEKVQRGEVIPPRLRDKTLSPALEAICLKAMARMPADRYPQATDLARDLERWLADEPVSAYQEPFSERARRFLKRHRTAVVGAAAAVLVALVALTISTLLLNAAYEGERDARQDAEWAAVEAGRERDRATRARNEAEEQRTQAVRARLAAEASERLERSQRYVTNINLAYQAWQTGQVVRTRQFLRALLPRPDQEDLRSFEWHYLWRLCHNALPRTFQHHTGAVVSIAFSPDGRQIATAGEDGTVLVWDRSTGQPLRTLVTDPDDRTGHLGVSWTSKNGRVVVSMVHPSGPAGLDGRLRPGDELLALSDKHRRYTEIVQPDEVRKLEFGPPGSTVLVEVRREGKSHSFTLVRRRFGVMSLKQVGPDRLEPARVAFTPEGQLVTVSGRIVQLWGPTSDRPLHTFKGHQAPIQALAISSEGTRLATGDRSGIIRLWDLNTREEQGSVWYRQPDLLEAGVARPVYALAFSPDGKTLLASISSYLALFDWNSKKIIDVAFQLENIIPTLAFHPKDSQVVLGGNNNQFNLQLWDPATRQRQIYLHGHSEPVRAVAFTPDGENVLSAGADHTARLWDRSTGKMLRLFRGHTRSVISLACSPDGQTIATGDTEGKVILHEGHRDPDALTIPGRSSDSVTNICFADNQTVFACAGTIADPGSTYLGAWEVRSGTHLGQVQGPPPLTQSLAFSAEGKILLVSESPALNGSLAGTCRLYNTATGQELGTLEGHTRGVSAVVISPDTQRVVTGAGESTDSRSPGEIIFWDLKKRTSQQSLRAHLGLLGLALSRDGKTLLSHGFQLSPRDSQSEALLWDFSTGKLKGSLKGKLTQVNTADLSPDGKFAVTVTANPLLPNLPSTVEVWDTTTAKSIASLRGHTSILEVAQFSPDGKTIWTGGWDKQLRVHEVPSGKLLRTLPEQPGWISSLDFSKEGTRVAVGVGEVKGLLGPLPSLARILACDSGKDLATFRLTPDSSVKVRFSPDEKTLAACTSSNDVRLFDVETGAQKRLAPAAASKGGHTHTIVCLAVSPDGKTLATGSWDKTVKLWKVLPREERLPAQLRETIPAGGVVSCLCFAPDGKTLAWGTGGILTDRQQGAVTLYDLETKQIRFRHQVHPAGITAVTFTPNSRTLVVATDHIVHNGLTSELRFLEVATGKSEHPPSREPFVTPTLAISPDGTLLAFTGNVNILLMDLKTRTLREISGHTQPLSRLAFSADGRTLASVSRDGMLKLWQVSSGQELLSLPHDHSIEALAFSPDGKTLVTGSKSQQRGILKVWCAEPFEIRHQVWFVEPGEGPARREIVQDEAGNVVEVQWFDREGKRIEP